MNKKKYRITFLSGVNTVTGSNFLFEGPLDENGHPGKRILIDCGLEQGEHMAEKNNWKPFIFDPATIDYLLITHAHIDHIGRIPKLVYDGFKGKIIATHPTCALTGPMLEDTGAILSHNSEEGLDKYYSEDMIKQSLSNWKGVDYEEEFAIDDIKIKFHNSGHILGSAYITFQIGDTKIVFTGDLGNTPSPILQDTTPLKDANYLIMESVYGDRLHENRENRRDMLKEVILGNYKRNGTLIIPAFSLERSQELLFEMDGLLNEKKIPKMSVFLDSPLAITVTHIYQRFADYFNQNVRDHIKSGNDPFSFPGLSETVMAEESKAILHKPNPKIIIAGSGMSSGGRVIHHEHNYLSDKNNTLLLIGYQAVGTLGRQIEDGAKSVFVDRQSIPVHAKIEKISGYSGHKDSDALVEFVSTSAKTIKQVFTVMGEPKASTFLAQRLANELGLRARSPEPGESVIIEI